MIKNNTKDGEPCPRCEYLLADESCTHLPKSTVDGVLADVKIERKRQDDKWGTPSHPIYKWLAVLGEEVGEANKAALEADVWLEVKNESERLKMLKNYREELIQVAAVAVAAIECLDRQGDYK